MERLRARLCLSGHGRPFVDIPGHIEGNRKLVGQRVDAALGALDGRGSLTVVELVPEVYGEPLSAVNGGWYLQETLCYLDAPGARGARRRGNPTGTRSAGEP